jgi:glycosyltransferase involved in cell wall biosynthesis
MISVNLLFRAPGPFFSLEETFDTMSSELPKGEFAVTRLTAPYGCASATALTNNLLWARRMRIGVNHIAGDIHYTALALPGKMTVLTIPDLRMLDGKVTFKKRVQKLLWYTLPARHAGYITVISEETKRELLRQVKIVPEKVRVIHCCVAPRFTYTPQPFNTKPNILQVGTTDNKNLLRLAQALKGIPCRLTILGRTTDEQAICLKLNNVEFQNVVGLSSDEVVELYKKSDLITFASTYEGFGLPIIEANAVGRPVITSNLSSMPEVAGDAALLVDPFDISAIRSAIHAVISNSDLREALVQKGLENIKRFSPQIIAGRYAELYRDVARGAR